MTSQQEIVSFAMRVLSSPDELCAQLRADPDTFMGTIFDDGGPDPLERALVGPQGTPKLLEAEVVVSAIDAYRRRLLQEGADALELLASKGETATLTQSQRDGLEAIIKATRPAILLQNDRFCEPPPEWKLRLEPKRDRIQANARNVGRIRTMGDPDAPFWGTGFVVGKDVIMTNRHVAEKFAYCSADQKAGFLPGKKVRWNNVDDPDRNSQSEFEIYDVIGVHPHFDLALLRLNAKSWSKQGEPLPLRLAAQAPASLQGRWVYTIGYPAYDAMRNDANLMRTVFGDIYGVKRLQPGAVMAYYSADSFFDHDCSTLGGNSGSCVIDLETHDVLGLHFEGCYMQYNRAVALWNLRDDALLRDAGVSFR